MHRLLERQLRRYAGPAVALPQKWQRFIDSVDQAYRQSDADRALLERSLELASQELSERNRQLQQQMMAEREQAKLLEEQSLALTKVVQTVAQGELAVEVEIPKGIPVLSELALGIDKMLNDLRQMMAEQERARAEIEKSRQQLQAALDEVLAVQQRYLRREWTDYTAQTSPGYILSESAEGPTSDAWLPAMKDAARQVRAVTEGDSLAVPIHLYGQVIGVLGFSRAELDGALPYSDEEIAAVEDIVEQVGLALENQRLFDGEQRSRVLLGERVKELDCLNDIGRKIDESPPIPEFLQWVAERVPSAMQYPDLCLAAIEFEGELYGTAEATSLPCQMVGGLRIGGQATLDLRAGEQAQVGDLNGTLLGRVTIAYTEEYNFIDEESALLGDVVRRVSGYIENHRLMQQTQAALAQVEETHRRYLRQEWDGFLAERAWGYVDGPAGLINTKGAWTPDMEQAVIEGGTITQTEQQAGQSALALPIKLRGQIIGALDFYRPGDNRAWTEDEKALVEAMADQVALALENARLFEEARRRAAEQQMLFDVTTAAVTTAELDQMLHRAAQTIHHSMGDINVAIMIVDEKEPLLRLRAVAGYTALQKDKLPIPVGHGITGWVALTGEPVTIDDVSQSPRYIAGDPNTRSELAVPIMVDQAVAGIINVESDQINAFGQNDLRLLQTLSGTLGAILKNVRLVEELQAANERLKEIDRLKSEFLANMSHELRTPLNSIIGFSRVIIKGIDGPITDLQRQDLTSIYNSGQHLLGLINNVLDLSKIEAGKMAMLPEATQLADTIQGVLSTAKGLIKGKGIKLHQEIPPELPPVWGDPFRLRQVLLNLISNSAKFTEQGSITIQAAYDSQAVFVQVIDTGIGISEEDMDKLFKAFSQVDASSTRKVGGTGLGLAISAQFMEMQGGRIWVESTLGQGSTFSIAIPRANATDDGPIAILNQTSADELPSSLTEPIPTKLLLVIDDEPGVIKLYRRYLAEHNYRVMEAATGQEGVERAIALAGRLTAVTVDIMLPDMDGWEVIRQLQEHPAARQIPIIVCSIKFDQVQAKALGIKHYLVKPILQDDLLQALDPTSFQ